MSAAPSALRGHDCLQAALLLTAGAAAEWRLRCSAVTSQIPGAALIQAKGVKPVLGLTMVGTCGTFFLLPWLARLGTTGTTAGVNVRIMAACLTVCGFCQGPLIPGQMTLRRSWLPKLGSPERPIHTKLMQLGAQFAGVLTAAAIPWTATRFGWASINRLAGGSGLAIAAVWFAKAAATPADYRRRQLANQADHSSAPTAAAAAPQKKKKAWDPRIFRDPALLATLWCKMASGNSGYTMSSYVPTIFIETLGCNPIQVSAYLLWQTPLRTVGGFLIAGVEAGLLKRGVDQLKIRKYAQLIGGVGSSIFAVAFGFCRTPLLAAICLYCEDVASLPCAHASLVGVRGG